MRIKLACIFIWRLPAVEYLMCVLLSVLVISLGLMVAVIHKVCPLKVVLKAKMWINENTRKQINYALGRSFQDYFFNLTVKMPVRKSPAKIHLYCIAKAAETPLFYSCGGVLIWLCFGADLWDFLKWIVYPWWAANTESCSASVVQLSTFHCASKQDCSPVH